MTVHYVDFGSESRHVRENPDPTRCSALDLELVRLVCGMPDRARAGLLAFLHLAKDHCGLKADLTVDGAGAVHLALVSTPGGDAA